VDALPYPIKFMGQINDETTMVVLNNATDLFVSPTLAESFGLTFLENILCGTPVVGFNVGGVPEIIEHKINGYLAEYKSSDDLARGILFCLSNQMIFKRPKQYFTNQTIDKHLNFINSILQTKK
jgi:glycosyltransferase involved in cell wall biosynthesis